MTDIRCTVKSKGQLIKKSDKFQSQKLVCTLEGNPMYPQIVEFEFQKDRCDLLEKINDGDFVTVSYDLKGREWKGNDGVVKVFNTINGWGIKIEDKATKGSTRASTPAPPAIDISQMGSDDDLPF